MITSHFYETLLALGVLSPFVSFWVLVFFGPRLGKPKAGWVAVVLGMGVPLVLATIVLVGWIGEVRSGHAAELTRQASQWQYLWANLGTVPVTLGVKLDSLTVAMYFMVTFIAFWIFVFSIGYMSGHSDEVAGQSKYSRFFAYLSLFGFSMLGLVISSSLLFLFVFWELVGLCSYLLIGFYFDKAFASAAAIKAFVTNRVGDFGFLIGLMLVFSTLHTLDLDQAAARFAQQSATSTGVFASSFTLFGFSLATLMGIGLFCGAMGKSAQFPLHVWLPDAMAGPTPVSALIHAATMVAAGVYLVARVFRLMTPDALMVIATVGCLTLTLMALVAVVQTDIKKCLAYSTLSQLGYMIFGMGCGAWIAAMFHLITHAFFKSMLFLGSGQVIEGCHHEQDMRRMGGLRRKMPVTCWTFFVGVLAISGAGIAGTRIGLGGFFSKDEILAVAYARSYEWDDAKKFDEGHMGGTDLSSHSSQHDAILSSEPRASARAMSRIPVDSHVAGRLDLPSAPGSSAFPMARLVSDPIARNQHPDATSRGLKSAAQDPSNEQAAIFGGMAPLPKWMFWLAIITAYVTPFYMMRCWWMTFMGKPRDEHVYEHAHEIPLMYVPLVVLALGTIASSYFIFRPLFAQAASTATAAPLVLAFDGTAPVEAIHHAHEWLMFGVGGAFLLGAVAVIVIYRRGLAVAAAIKQASGPVYTVLVHKYFFDEMYDLLWVRGCILVAKIARLIDTYVVDLVFDLLALLTERLAAFSGLILDNHGVDGFVNGVAQSTKDFAGILRRSQTGRIRNYVLITAAVATAVLLCVWIVGTQAGDMVLSTAELGAR